MVHSNVVKIRVGGGRIRSRGQARWSGRRRRTYELRPAAVASGREARDTTRLVATRGGCEMAVHRFGVVAFFPLSSLFRDKDGTSLPALSLPWRGHDCERRLERHAPQPTQSVGRGDTAERRHHAPPRADVVRRFDATACGCWTHASVLAHWRASAAPQHEPANLIVGRRSSYIIIIIIGAIVFFFS